MSFRTASLPALILLIGFAALPDLSAYPEFQVYVAESTGRTVNCAMCHSNSDGPEGTGPGQIGRLNPAELERLGHARSAFQPGQEVDSPILNAFGNHIVTSIGKEKFVELKAAPAHLAELLPPDSDLDHDGIPDAREYLDGTHPVNRNDGNPILLFKHNFRTNFSSIILTLAATISGVWGIGHLLQGFSTASRLKDNDHDEENL